MEAKVETVELFEKDNDINLFFTRLPPARTLKKMMQMSKNFWKIGSKFSPTFQDVKRIITSQILDESIRKEKTFTTISIVTKFVTETENWLREQGYSIIRTEKTFVDNMPAIHYTISWVTCDEADEPNIEVNFTEE